LRCAHQRESDFGTNYWWSKDIYQLALKKYKADHELLDLPRPKQPGFRPELSPQQVSSLNLSLGCAFRVGAYQGRSLLGVPFSATLQAYSVWSVRGFELGK
jgi:hypothetical protein